MKKAILATAALAVVTAAMVSAQQARVTLRVQGFTSPASEIGTPLDLAKKKFIADAQRAIPGLTIRSEESPPNEAQRLVDIAAGTAADIWYQDASSLAKFAASGNLLDMRKCLPLVPALKLDRFWPNVLKIHQQPDGAIYGLPDGFTPMVIYYNPEVFAKYKVPVPKADWTWNDLVRTAQLLTVDKNGRNATQAGFDENNVATWGFRVRKFPFEWVYRLWQNGGDVLSPDGTTASGYLDSPASIEAIQFQQDLVYKYKVAPKPTVLDQMVQQLGFNDRFLTGDFAMFDRGHWELVGLRASKNFKQGRVAVVGQPRNKTNATVFYESGWVINKAVERDPAKLKAACQLVERATDVGYQQTKAVTGLEISGNRIAARGAVAAAPDPAVERVFVNLATAGRPPYGSKYAFYPAVETILDSMMDRILRGAPVAEQVRAAVTEINREVAKR
ncbi:MAG TPA: extracellular solute-binding protein [Deinococcales bacterium]|nr:extracellular solute-binding protein [Deinococcales bacterium]